MFGVPHRKLNNPKMGRQVGLPILNKIPVKRAGTKTRVVGRAEVGDK